MASVTLSSIPKASIGYGHYVISDKDAARVRKINGVKPRHGYEHLVEVDGKFWFLKQMTYRDRLCWMLFGPTAWRMNGLSMILNQDGIEQNQRDERDVWDAPEKFGIVTDGTLP